MGPVQPCTSMYQVGAVCATLLASVSCFPYPQGPAGPGGPLPIPRPGADGAYKTNDYFQYINVPAHKTFEWGYRRGNPDHNREEYLSQKDHTFKAKLKWHDAYGGHGEHYYDYNHGDSYGKEPAYHEPAPAYHEPEPPTYHAGSEPVPAYTQPARNRRSLPFFYL